MTDKNITDLAAGVAVSLSDLFVTRQGADTEDTKVTGTQIKTAMVTTANNLSVYAAGTAYALTATAAALDFGTTDPSLTLTLAGTYRIRARVRLDYNAATFAAVRTATLKLRRTNNTAADLTNGSVGAKTQIVTTISGTFIHFSWEVDYTTVNTNDAVTIFGSLDVVPEAGSLDAVEASIMAHRLQQ